MKQSLLNQKQGKMGSGMVTVIILLVALFGLGYFLLGGSTQQAQIGDNVAKAVASSCEVEPYISNTTFNDYTRSTQVGVAMQFAIDEDGNKAPSAGEIFEPLTTGSTGDKFRIGDGVLLFSTLAGHLDQWDYLEIKSCGENRIKNYVLATDGGSIDILTNDFTKVSDASTSASTTNLTDGSSTTPVTVILRVTGVIDESTGQLYVTVEGNDTEIDKIEISARTNGAEVIDGDAPILDVFASEGTSPTIKKAFVIAPVLDGAEVEYGVKFTPESAYALGKHPAGSAVFFNAYEGQWFVDTDGTLKFGWENADGTAKHEGAFTDHDAVFS